MPLAQYVRAKDNIRVTHKIPTPKQLLKMNHWYSISRKYIKDMPKLGEDGWQIFRETINGNTIWLELVDRYGNKAHLVIDRSVPAM